MRVAIMQPYLLPYVGYFQLLQAADVFVLLDDVQYTSRGWINRNRLLVNNREFRFTLPVVHGARESRIQDIRMQPDQRTTAKLLATLEQSYRRAVSFEPVLALSKRILLTGEVRLTDLVENSLREVMSYVGLTTPLLRSSTLGLSSELRAQDRILAICRQLGATQYLNLPGGVGLYCPTTFTAQNLELQFLRPVLEAYPQAGPVFVPGLSILDLLMHTSRAEALRHCSYEQLLPESAGDDLPLTSSPHLSTALT